MARAALSAAQARRVALAAQGFGGPRGDGSGPPGARAMLAMAQRLGVLQIDSVNVLVRAHYLPLFSRLGPVRPRAARPGGVAAPRRLFEYWGHEASLLPVALQPLLRWRMARAARRRLGRHAAHRDASSPSSSRACSRTVRGARAGSAASELADDEAPRARRARGGTGRDVKRALEWLFWSGQVTSARRRGFERLYDLPERVLPRRCRGADARRGRRAARARAHRRARARRRDRARPARLLPPAGRRRAGAPSPSSWRRASCCRSRSRAGSRRRTWTRARACRAGVRRPRAARAVRPARVGARRASSGCSASATASRSTCPRPSACTATTCCRSCSATGSSRGSTSRPIARRARCLVQARVGGGGRRRARPRPSWPRSCRRWRGGSASSGVEVRDRGDLAGALRGAVGRGGG